MIHMLERKKPEGNDPDLPEQKYMDLLLMETVDPKEYPKVGYHMIECSDSNVVRLLCFLHVVQSLGDDKRSSLRI